jgi:type I restriction enzyme S subunit
LAEEAAVFFKTREQHGGLSNMASGFSLCVSGVDVRSSEALYQLCRYPDLPEAQLEILRERSPMTAKMKSKKYRSQTRSDWLDVRVPIMKWCLRVKLVQNYESFSRVLEETGSKPIVEKKIKREDFWGAKVQEDGSFVGRNVLGRLLMELREKVRAGEYDEKSIVPPPVSGMLILGRPIGETTAEQKTPERLI